MLKKFDFVHSLCTSLIFYDPSRIIKQHTTRGSVRLISTSSVVTSGLSHVDVNGNPCMVNVSSKNITARSATARASVQLPGVVFDLLQQKPSSSTLSPNIEIFGAKGPVFATAIIAGTMGAKRTAELIPFCHPLPIEHISIDVGVDPQRARTVGITCTVRTTGKTGVEMEALTGASVTALCIYDMLKALSHEIVVSDVKLISKTGGKSDVRAA